MLVAIYTSDEETLHRSTFVIEYVSQLLPELFVLFVLYYPNLHNRLHCILFVLQISFLRLTTDLRHSPDCGPFDFIFLSKLNMRV